MRKTKEEAEVTREKLLDAGLKVFSRKGYATATLDDIAKEAGVTRGAVYWHFKGGKADLMVAILNDGLMRVNDIMLEVIAAEEKPINKLERLAVRMLEFLEEDEKYRALQEILIFKTGEDPDLTLRLADKQLAQRETLKNLAAMIDDAKAAGEVRKDVDTTTIALAYYGMINGIVLLWMVDRSVSEHPQFSIKDRAEPITKLFIESIATQ
ncbi:MAG TPA: TetR family transcriptional regulator [Methanocella sp.]|jgi:TetR/AcrR family acrAB operon transcriptional repressor